MGNKLAYRGRIGGFAPLVELPGIEQIVPYTVESSGNGGDRGEKGVAHPDGKYSVLLSEWLAGTDTVVVDFSYSFAYIELYDAGYQRNNSQSQLVENVDFTMYNTFYSDSDGEGESYCPHVESQFMVACQQGMKFWKEVAN